MLSESQISKLIQEYLESLGIEWYWRNQVYKGKVKSGAYLQTGKKGISDLVFIAYNQTFYIEVKDHEGVQSEDQIKFQKHCEANNQIYILARSVEDVSNYLTSIK